MTVHESVTAPPDRPARHRLDRGHFAALAAGDGDPDTISELLSAERSWRLVQLRAVLDAVATDPEAVGPLPPVAAAWELLVAAQRRAADEVDRLILHPQVGTWAGYVLRRLRGGTVTADGPLWVDLGYLHALAVVAAVRAGVGFTMRVPVRDGFVALPTLGGASLPSPTRWAHADVVGADGAATVRVADRVVRFDSGGTGTEGWLALPTIRAEAHGATLAVTLDFLDPYRNLRTPTPPDLDTVAQLDRWRALLTEAWQLLMRVCPDRAAPIARGLTSVVPQRAAERYRTMSASAGDAFGSMIMSEPEDAPELAVTLVHEFQHIKLGGLLHLTPLLWGEPAQRLYAPWRDDPRPLGGLLQGVYAFVGITDFWRSYRLVATGPAAALAHFEFARWRRQVRATLRMMCELPELNDVGRRLVAGLLATADAWQDEDVPADLLAAARTAVADHRARWRLHHRRPDRSVVVELARAWHAGRRPAVAAGEPVVVTDGSARRLDTQAVLQMWRITDPDGFAQLCKDPSAVGVTVSGATAADLALAAGDVAGAHAGYLAELAAGDGSPGAWAGLGLTTAVLVPGRAAEALRDRPELVRAVHREVADPAADPLAVADWVGALPAVG
ncbi:HEXXH motif domain-containing protein [Micromonospora endolithica]|nr:HEXXH motif domain-containing protein [Micromonospora endolithica]TWJ21945.1 HEXXH motif-containing protein [Micromonospora endolithica]